jgi:K(+)-stimulated pyrophosphate-energized sodium pump
MFVAFVGMIGSIIGSFMVKGGTSTDSHALSRALHMGTNVAMAITVFGVLGGAYWIFDDADKPWGIALSVIGGLVIGWGLGKCAEYFTSDHFNPVKKIAKQSETGPATTVLAGVSIGMASVFASVAPHPRRHRRRLLGRPAGVR